MENSKNRLGIYLLSLLCFLLLNSCQKAPAPSLSRQDKIKQIRPDRQTAKTTAPLTPATILVIPTPQLTPSPAPAATDAAPRSGKPAPVAQAKTTVQPDNQAKKAAQSGSESKATELLKKEPAGQEQAEKEEDVLDEQKENDLARQTADKQTDLEKMSLFDHYRPDKQDRYLAYKKKMPELSWEQAITHVNIGLDQPYYSKVQISEDEHALHVLVNKYNKLPDNFKPQNLVTLPAAYAIGEQQMTDVAAQAFIRMADAAEQAGFSLKAYSCYRSLAEQEKSWQDKVNSGRSKENVDAWNARSGHSEHHLGLAVDINKDKPAYWKKGAEFYQTGLWLQENAFYFGFILRYPAGKEKITGYQPEAWHFRYVGIELAAQVKASGLTYDEYYERFLR